MGRHDRDHYRWVLAALRLVDADRIGQVQLVGLAPVIADQAIVDAHVEGLIDDVDGLDAPDVAIVHVERIVVPLLDHPVAHAEPSPAQAPLRLLGRRRVEGSL